MLAIRDFTVEYQRSPLGLDERSPRFSWKLEADGENIRQKSCRLTVTCGTETVFDSGLRAGEESVLLPYAGTPLEPLTAYRARIEATDNRGQTASAELTFETGFLDPSNLTAEFITHGFGEEIVCPALVKRFRTSGRIRRARAYATALGMYELRINGSKAGDIWYAPYWTSYSHRLEYQTYDVTALLRAENTVEMILADGWYKGELTWLAKRNLYGNRLAGLLELHIEYEDGTSERIVTDESWTSRETGIRASSIYHGEVQDTAFVSQEMRPVRHYPHRKDILIGQINEPVRETGRLAARSLTVSPKGEHILDFGQNLTGVVEIRTRLRPGQRLVLRHAEMLDRYGNLYTDNLRHARAEDVYLGNGEEQVLRPHFTFHGFRYVEVLGLDRVDPAEFTAVVLHSDMARTGTFECSNEDVNRLYSNQLWGQRGNFLDVPTDCPQRDERLGWTADAQVYCRTAGTNYNTALFFTKWLGDVAAEQTEEYGVPHIVPNPLEKTDSAAAVWSDAATIVPWTLYQLYGDVRILERQFDSMCGWVDYITRHTENGLWMSGFQFGDWLALDKDEFSDRTGSTDAYFIANVFYLYSARITADAARVLERPAEAERYAALCQDLLERIRREYVTPNGRLVSETQTALVLALHFGLLKQEHVQAARVRLRANLERFGHLMTGFVGTPYLCTTLTDNQMQDLAAMVLLREEFPGWIYQIRLGATTVWERWDGIRPDGSFNGHDMNSFNHYAYGSVGEWMYRRLAGIDLLEPGYKRILIAPRLLPGIDRVSASVESMYGTIACSVDYARREMHVKIPPNTSAEIRLPDGTSEEKGSGSYRLYFEQPL